ncbi:cell wall-active antibiotics response protein LiaF [Paenibacillus sp. GCM10023248]|uniref:cell wall-active antibiotics response protein LiaF n=1 Tax=Bacillales TaxID=1385 RepID=UPI0023792F7D|nr:MULTISPECIES: cell wall-active antibiotics response protein LiaF [Bacillales]MDD9271166.1 cell wall-active antibiotics response protein LiaF [Paenibacillus sp. MAHUQ-63]MDR6881717.1 lia operon protein LiaF [Bacillus sp. 3255]
MGEETKNNRNRNTALVLIGAGLFLLLDHTIGFFPILAIILVLLGIHRVRSRKERKGFVLIAVGGVILFGDHVTIVISIVLISLGVFFIRSKQMQKDDTYIQKQKLVDSVRLGREPWIMRNSSTWYIIGETYIDLSLAILEQKETTVILQGVVGDVDIKVPDDIGVSVAASVTFGQIQVGVERESGVMNKLHWQSPNYERCDHRVKLVLSYIVGDIKIKVL